MIEVLARDLGKSFGNESSLEPADDIVLVSLNVQDPFGLYRTASIREFLYRFIDIFGFKGGKLLVHGGHPLIPVFGFPCLADIRRISGFVIGHSTYKVVPFENISEFARDIFRCDGKRYFHFFTGSDKLIDD